MRPPSKEEAAVSTGCKRAGSPAAALHVQVEMPQEHDTGRAIDALEAIAHLQVRRQRSAAQPSCRVPAPICTTAWPEPDRAQKGDTR